MDGSDWYQDFVERVICTDMVGKFAHTMKKSRRWTNCMLGFLEEWGESKNYTVRLAPGTATLVDMKWLEKDRAVLALEHENNWSNFVKLRPEIEKLIGADAELKVLITYVSNRRFPEKSKELFQSISEKLAESSKVASEFLLIIGPWAIAHPSEFVCYRFFPGFRNEVVLPRYHKNGT